MIHDIEERYQKDKQAKSFCKLISLYKKEFCLATYLSFSFSGCGFQIGIAYPYQLVQLDENDPDEE